MTAQEYVTAIRKAHEALMAIVKLAREDGGLTVDAEFEQYNYGPWSLNLTIRRIELLAENDGPHWKVKGEGEA